MCRKFAITGAVHCTDTAVTAIFQRHRTFTLSRQGFITPATHRFSSVDVKVPLMKPRKLPTRPPQLGLLVVTCLAPLDSTDDISMIPRDWLYL